MKKLLIFVAAVATTGASYFLLTKATDTPNTAASNSPGTNALEIEEFETPHAEDATGGDTAETAGADYFENDYDRYDDPTAGILEGQDSDQAQAQAQAQSQQVNAADLEPIDDADAPTQNNKGQDKSEAQEPLTTARSR
ncbi:MAG: hypothetical protein FJ146_12815 [Deltaproteobacteria bacterium]|nr:hypothetical protein [Deltaproteobacteria bacterium]